MNPRALFATVGLIAAGGALALTGLLTGLVGPGEAGAPIPNGRPATITFTGAPTMIWASEEVPVRCEPDTTGASSQESARGRGFTTGEWRGALLVTADPPGERTWTCSAIGSVQLSVGTPPLLHELPSMILTRLGIALLTVLALVMAILAVMRRRAT